jgi:hypothetical protein
VPASPFGDVPTPVPPELKSSFYAAGLQWQASYVQWLGLGLGILGLAILAAAAKAGYGWLVALIVFAGSIVLFAINRQVFDGVSPLRSLDPTKQFWSFLFGDVIIAVALAVAVDRSHQWFDQTAWYAQPWWPILAYVASRAVAQSVVRLFSIPDFVRQNALALQYDPANVFHFYTTYTIVAGGVILVGVPLLVHHWNSWVAWLPLAAVMLWVAADPLRTALIGKVDLFEVLNAYNYVERAVAQWPPPK